MFNSPARATPRRGLRARDSISRGPSMFESSAPPTRSRLGSTQPLLRPVSPASSAGDSVHTQRTEQQHQHHRQAEEWDLRSTWSRDTRHSVTAAGPLPSEVAALVKGADFIVNSVAGHVDPSNGYALVASPSSVVAWNYAKRTHSSPTVYRFEAPPVARLGLAATPPALATFVGAGNEPGLLLVSATGEVRFWESVNHGLVDPQHQRYALLQLNLGDDFAERMWKVDATSFILTTTASTAWRIAVANIGGRVVPTATQFTRNSGMFNRSSPIIFTDRDQRNGVVAVAPTTGGVYILGRSTLQKWGIAPDGNTRLVQEFDLRESIGASLFEDERTWQSGAVHLELNDLVSVGSDQLAAFVSYTTQGSSTRRTHNSHKIVVFDYNHQSNVLTIVQDVHLSYVAHSDPRMLDIPRLYIPSGAQTAFVRFADAIVVTSLSSIPYEDTITLKDSSTNAFIGVGTAKSGNHNAALVAMAASGGIMAIEVHPAVAQARHQSSIAAATARIKSKLEQAVFFGDRSENPLTFDLPAGWKGDLSEAAEGVSTEIVSSTSPYMPHISDIRIQLADRLARLKELMKYIHRNGGLSLLHESSRRRLCGDAEKVQAAIDLWDYQNRVMDHLHTRSPESLLGDSIQILMNQLGSSADDDVVRSFFRTQVAHLDRLLESVYATFQAAVTTAGQGADLTAWVLEANRIFLTVLRSSARYREATNEVYSVDRSHPVIELWTASDAIINEMDALYSATQRLIKDRTRMFGSVVDEGVPKGTTATTGGVAQKRDQATLKLQMAHLAAALCQNMEDKLRASATQMNGGVDPNEGLTLAQRWDEMKPRIIRPLVDIDCVDEAYQLAEHHRDFPALVYLCNNPVSAKGNGQARIETFIEQFGAEFAFVLYQWYIDQGDLYALLSQDEVYGGLLTAFFDRFPHPELSWVHDIASKRYGTAAAALVAVDGHTAELAQKQLIASIAKLSAVADTKAHGATPGRTALLSEIDDGLDAINAEEDLADSIRALAPTSGYPRVPGAKAFVDAHATRLTSRPAFRAELERDVTDLLAGTALGIESLVDALTLADMLPDRSGDAALALDRLARASLPEGRKQVALLSIWRRVFIYDDWADIAKTAGRSEETQRNLMRGSRTYATLEAIGATDLPSSYILAPKNATLAPLPSEIAARFPAYTPGQVEALMADHGDEIAVLDELIAEQHLDQIVRAVSELVESDRCGETTMLGSDTDVDM